MSAHHHGEGCVGQRDRSVSGPLRSTLAYLEREAARRAKGTHPGMMRLQDDELGALVEVLRREVRAPVAHGVSEKTAAPLT